jgi:hypothetical protein
MSIQSLQKAAFAICILAVALFAAENPFVGAWKLNAAKSKLAGTGLGEKATVHIESDGKSMKVSVESTDPKGQPLNFTYEATLDGKPGKATGSPTFDEISLKRINEHTISAIGKKDGKVVFTDRRTVSKGDGKTMTLLRTGTDAAGKTFHATLVFDKQ